MKKLYIPLLLSFILSFTFIFINNNENKVKEKLPSFVPDDDWFERQRAYPFTEIPNGERLKSIEYVKRNFSADNVPVRYRNLTWQLSGPINIEGRITTVAIDPVNQNIVYVGTANGGVFKSTNYCQTYQSIFDDQNTTSIGDIAIDPINSNIIYCGTGEANSLRSYYPGTGMYKSTDAGSSWTFIGLAESNSIGRIAINPLNTQEIYAAALGALRKKNDERGLYKSTNGGLTWNNILYIADSVGVVDVVLDPSDPQKVFAAAWERFRREDRIKYGGPKSALYYSTNGGTSWTTITNGFPSGSSTLGRISMDFSVSNPLVMYALISNTSGGSGGLYKSTNGGMAWTLKNASVGSSSTYAWFNRICRVNPSNPEIVYCGGLEMERSINGGSSFSYIYGPHVDHHAAAFSKTNPNYVIIGNDGGIDYTTNGGTSWIGSEKLPVTQFYAGEIHPTNTNIILGGAQDNGTLRTLTGNLNDWVDIFGGDGFYCRIDYNNPNRMYASSQNGGLGYSTDGGNYWNYATSGLDVTYTNWMTPYTLDKNNPMILYCGTYKMHRSTNGMQSWTVISPDLTSGHVQNLGTITTVDVAKSNPNVIYCGTDDANVWVTTNGGTNWTPIKNWLPNRWVTRVTIDPDSANICYVSLSGYKIDTTGAHIFRTTNYGSSWTSISGNLPDAPINDIIVDPLDHNSLYIATDNGVFFTTNLGSSWYILGDGIPGQVPCHDLTFHEATRKLVVWTHGKSSFSLILPNPPVPVELAAFDYSVGNGAVELKWQTSSELNNKGFEIERSVDNRKFFQIGFAPGNGTTTEINYYSFTDKTDYTGKLYYRLKQIDYDGSYTYSKVLEAETFKDFSLAQNYPNPFNSSTQISYNLRYDSEVSIEVFTITGEKLVTLFAGERKAGTHKLQFSSTVLASGVYIYKISAGYAGGNFSSSKKLVVLK